ncbi:cytidine deaminase [Pseudidiomarina insulisalsae]|uniref:Cytidine deaminase n=2 Tax=Pseudidiomarina insulisalsae TaxID=575789 RepID=A0A432Y8Q7_9GAMM|nr:cytidine deaminase [Pseudidiomarina insulisalsae]
MSKSISQIEFLREHAKQASQKAYAPYSQFHVGAALLMRSGEVVTGCNVENASYGLSNCAERTAVFNAVAQGYDPADIAAVAIYTATEKACAPCGACRQVLAEFLQPGTMISSTSERQLRQWSIEELLPDGFEFDIEAYRKPL